MKKNVSIITRFFVLTVVLAMMIPAMSNAQAGKTDFSGKWKFNESKSQLPQGGGGQGGGMGRMGAGDFSVKQEANLLTVTTSRQNQDGQTVTTDMKYTLDGKETINASQRGDSKSVAKWSADGKTLTITTSRTMDFNGETRTMNSTEVWVLTDPKTLTRTTTRPGMDGAEMKTVTVFDKQ
jgi:hypothetical protein